MKKLKILKIIMSSLILMLPINTIALKSSYALEDILIAVVDDELITFSDLKDYIRSTYAAIAAQKKLSRSELSSLMKDLETNGLKKLIDDKLILSEANRLGIKAREQSIEDKLNEIKSRYSSEDEFRAAIIETGVSITDLKEKIADQLKISYVLDDQIKARIVVNPQEVTDFYNKNISNFYSKERINLDSIFIGFKKDKQNAREKIQQVVDKLKNGEDFKSVMKEFSEAPSVGIMERGQLMPDVEKKIFSLTENQVSEIIEVETGYFIFKILGRTDPKIAPLKDVKQQITNLLFDKKYSEALQKWIEELYKNSYVEIKK